MNTKDHFRDVYHLQHVSSPQNYWLYGYIKALGVKSLFEFGCNAGRHLHQLKRQGVVVDGVDLSARAVEAAKFMHGLDLRVGDESALQSIPAGVFEAVLTVSVLSHMETIGPTIAQLKRIATKHVFMVETRSRAESANHWWVHEYPGKSVYQYHAGQVNAVYQVWHLRK